MIGTNTLINVFNITPSDSDEIVDDSANPNPELIKAVYVFTLSAGDVSVITAGGEQLDFVGLSAGQLVGWTLIKQVLDTGTDATVAGGIVGNS